MNTFIQSLVHCWHHQIDKARLAVSLALLALSGPVVAWWSGDAGFAALFVACALLSAFLSTCARVALGLWQSRKGPSITIGQIRR